MGGGNWTKNSFVKYSASVGRSVNLNGSVIGNYSAQEMFKMRNIASELNPYGVVRECCDSSEHPKTKPVILALDVTGSMGGASVEIAKKLNIIMTELYDKVKDVEFLIMGIGDLACDNAPIQASQFESDIRIAEQLDKIYFEGGGGGNGYESYTAAWYFGLQHTKLDCWGRGEKGIIITIGDEPLNPYLPKSSLGRVMGNKLQADIETKDLYVPTTEKFNIYHLAVDDRETSYRRYSNFIKSSFGKYLDDEHLRVVNMDNLSATIISIITSSTDNHSVSEIVNDKGEISW